METPPLFTQELWASGWVTDQTVGVWGFKLWSSALHCPVGWAQALPGYALSLAGSFVVLFRILGVEPKDLHTEL